LCEEVPIAEAEKQNRVTLNNVVTL
jgi:hypothetical protein